MNSKTYNVIASILMDKDYSFNHDKPVIIPFQFIEGRLISGYVSILKEDFQVKKIIAKVQFLSDELLGDLSVGSTFQMFDGKSFSGHGQIEEIIGWQ